MEKNPLLEKNWAELKSLMPKLYNKDFLLTWENSDDNIKSVLLIAEMMKELHRIGKSIKVFETGLGISIFRDNSTRTRFSFASAVNALGLGLSELDEVKSQVAHGETVRETANMISFLAETIGIRDDMYIGEGNRYMREVSASIDDGFKEGILPQRTSIINLQCDIDHPTQTMADLLKLKHYFGSLENLKGKKIAMSWAYSPSYGKPLSVPQGIIGLMTRMGMDVSLAYPEGYELLPEVIELAKKQTKKTGSTFKVTNSMEEAFEGADVVYPKSWAPFHVMVKRTELLKQSDKDGLKDLEKACLANNAKHTDWECDASKMKLTKQGKALYMHCLPADITDVSCKQGEVSKKVFEKYRLQTYHQASYKPFVIAAMIFLTRMPDPIMAVSKLLVAQKSRGLVI
ncbi:MAG TPA: knotted carbamoyltransferase YgeW [Candidatus Cloacimonadota bacterium]|nr:knotted carbamoyltransferase YgeW [Candidatus Cloacimonadota bacterium]